MSKKNKSNFIDIFLYLILIIGMIVGLYFLLFPIYQSRVLEKESSNQVIKQFEERLEYDNTKDVQKDKSSLDLSLAQEEVIGVIYIPKLDLTLPIYEGINEKSLSEGAGTMTDYGYPNGEIGTHSVITSHSGLSSSGLFSSINKLNKNDIYFIKDALGTISKYVVNNIVTIEPTDFSHFERIDNKAITTLLTCTPIGINSHRLLVQGEKIDFDISEFENMDSEFTLSDYEVQVIYILSGLTLATLIVLIIFKRKKYFKKGGKYR